MKSAPHVGLARKHRPQGFDEVVGQEAVTVTLRNAVASGKPAHAYLFFGPRGVGKTTTARILAKALNCQKGPTAEPCGKCAQCQEIAQSSDLDVLELDAATHTQVEKIREMILETVGLAPARDRHKVFIIDEVHMLSASSFNALLKTLEEPPPHVVFILATTEAAKIPATIVSRCQRFRFRPLPVEMLGEHLARLAKEEKIKAEPRALELLARAAGGSLRDAVSLLDQAQAFGEAAVTEKQVTDLLGTLPEDALRSLAAAVLAKDAKALAEALGRVLEEGYDPAQIARDLRERFQAAFLHRLGVSGAIEESWKELAAAHGAPVFSYLVGRMNRALEQMRTDDAPRLALEQALYGALEPALDLGQWVERLESLERRLASGGAQVIAPAQPTPSISPLPQGGRGQGEGTIAKVAPPAASAPAQSRPHPAPQPAPHPSPSPAGRGSNEGGAGIWQTALQQLREEKPGLASYLETAQVSGDGAGGWKFVFGRSFELEQAKRSQPLIEAKMATLSGKPVRLSFEIGEVAPRASGSEEAPAPETEPVEDPALKKVLEIFPGRVKPLKKKP